MVDEIKEKIRLVPDFPKQGVLFRDITTLLKDPNGLRDVMKYFKIRYKGFLGYVKKCYNYRCK